MSLLDANLEDLLGQLAQLEKHAPAHEISVRGAQARERVIKALEIAFPGKPWQDSVVDGQIVVEGVDAYARVMQALAGLGKAKYDESKHPRDERGRWTEVGYVDRVTPGQVQAIQSTTERIRRNVEAAYSLAQELHDSAKWQQGGDDLRRHLQDLSDFYSQQQGAKPENNPAAWKLNYGQAYPFDASSYAGEREEQNQCYQNATLAAAMNPDLTYVEGYVGVHGVPLEHAWLVDPKGHVIDPTIRQVDAVTGYFGVPFQTSYLKKATLRNKMYGLLTWRNVHKTISDNPNVVVEHSLRKFNPYHDERGRFAESPGEAGLAPGLKLPAVTPVRVPYGPEPAIVMTNPSEGQIKQLARNSGSARVLRDGVGNLYAWDSEQALHHDIASHFGGGDFYVDYGPRNLFGRGDRDSPNSFKPDEWFLRGGKLVSSVSDRDIRTWIPKIPPHIRQLYKFDPEQPRDDHGRWTDSGRGSGALGHGYSEHAFELGGKIYTSDVYDAVRALYENRPVVLSQPEQVSVLVDKLAPIARRMVELGGKAPVFNLCNVSLRGTNLFCADTQGLPRIKMPQVKDPSALKEYLRGKGVKLSNTDALVSHLRPTQNELNGASVSAIANRIRSGTYTSDLAPMMVSKDNYILDGHHRWAANIALAAGKGDLDKLTIPVTRADIPITELLEDARKFSTHAHPLEHARWMRKFNPYHDELGRFTFGPASSGPPPAKDKPVVLVFAGSFNPPHTGHRGAVADAAKYVESQGYKVDHTLVVPSPSSLIDRKLGAKAYPLHDRVEMTRLGMAGLPGVEVLGEPSRVAEEKLAHGDKLRRTDLADWARQRFPGHTIIAVTGDTDAPGANPPPAPAIFSGDKGSKHEGYYYAALERPPGSVSSTKVRNAIRSGRPVSPEDVLPEVMSYVHGMLARKPYIEKLDRDFAQLALLAKAFVWDESKHPRVPKGSAEGGRFTASNEAFDQWFKESGWSIDTVKQLVKEYGYDPDKVAINTGDRTFQLNGKEYHYAGAAYLDTGVVEFYPRNIAPGALSGIVAHEVMHQKFGAYQKDLRVENSALMRELQLAPTGPNDPMRADGTLQHGWENKYPLYQQHVLLTKDHDKLIADDGVSSYSRDWWDAWRAGNAQTDQATHETLAEIARLVSEGNGVEGISHIVRKPDGFLTTKPLSPEWAGLFDAVNRHWAKKVAKFNPYHDELGRFTFGGGGLRPPGSEVAVVATPFTGSKRVEVLVNPSLKDAKAFAREAYAHTLRVLRDKGGNIYLWDSDKAIHYPMEVALGLEGKVGPGDADAWYLNDKGRFQSDNGSVADGLDPPQRTFEIPKEWMARSRGLAMAKRVVVVKYSPDQPRDAHGRFAEVGGGFSAATPQQFITARERSKRATFLSPKGSEELQGDQLYLGHGGKVGYALDKDGDLQNVFNNGGPPGAGMQAVVDAVKNGANTLDCFDSFLPGLYAKAGFVATGRVPFNDLYAPRDWDYEQYGRPDVVFMAYRGGDRGSIEQRLGKFPAYEEGSGKVYADYDTAKAASRRAVMDKKAPGRAHPGAAAAAERYRPGQLRQALAEHPRRAAGRGEFLRKRPNRLLALISKEWDESKHPRVPKGSGDPSGQFTSVGAATPADEGLHPDAVNVGGDEWNRQTAVRLEREYQQAKPALEKTIAATLATERTTTVKPPNWDSLTSDQQAAVKKAYIAHYLDNEIDHEVENWKESGQAKSDAGNTVSDALNDPEKNEWALEALQEYREQRAEEGKAALPFTDAQLLAAMEITSPDYTDPKAEAILQFDDQLLQSPANFDPNQLTLPGVEPLRPEQLLSPPMRKELTAAVLAAFEVEVEDEVDRQETPEWIKESAEESLEMQWVETEPDEAYKFAAKVLDLDDPENYEHVNVTRPRQFDPIGDYSMRSNFDVGGHKGKAYAETQAFARAVSEQRAAELLVERGLFGSEERDLLPGGKAWQEAVIAANEKVRSVDTRLWSAWKSSSTSMGGKILQLAAAEELGGRLRSYGSGSERNGIVQWANDEFPEIGGYEGVKAVVRAKWETTQYMLEQAGRNELGVYRGVNIPESKAPGKYETVELDPVSAKTHGYTYKVDGPDYGDSKYFHSKEAAELHAKAQNEAAKARAMPSEEVKVGRSTYERLTDITIERNGAASTTVERRVANDWGSNIGRVVLRLQVPRTAVLSVPVYGINVHGEKEVVVAGTAWKKWDAWRREAPPFEDHPIHKARYG